MRTWRGIVSCAIAAWMLGVGAPPAHAMSGLGDQHLFSASIPIKGRVAGPQTAQPPPLKKETPATQPLAAPSQAEPSPVTGAPVAAAEKVEVDVSTQTVAITSVFSGTEIIIFGTIINSRQVSAESGFYDIAVVVEGKGAPTIVRLKSNMGGLWVNMKSVRF